MRACKRSDGGTGGIRINGEVAFGQGQPTVGILSPPARVPLFNQPDFWKEIDLTLGTRFIISISKRHELKLNENNKDI